MSTSRHQQSIFEKAINGGEKEFNTFFKNTWGNVAPALIKLTNSEETAKELFVEGMSILWDNFSLQQKELPQNVNAYLYIVCKNEWISQRNKNKNKKEIPLSDLKFSQEPKAEELSIEEIISEEIQEQQLNQILSKGISLASERCKKIIELHLKQGKKLVYLWKELGYETYQSIVQAKYNCKKKLGDYIFLELNRREKNQHNKEKK